MAEALVTYLEMTKPPSEVPVSAPLSDVSISKESKIDLDLYLHFQEKVGGDYHWVERLKMPRDEVRQIIHSPNAEIFVLRCADEYAGFCEFNLQELPDLELKFFGLMPQYIGRGLGKYFLSQMIAHAWTHAPHRLWLHTDSNDHPRALENYKNAGFKVYKQVLEPVVLSSE